LFIGSCGRPDLVGSVGFTSEQMGQLMFNTLKNKICTLPSTVKVFPAHGAGSPCGKNLSSDLYSTIGKEKETNPALQYTDEKEFIKFLTSDQPAAPSYFSYNVQQNTTGAMALRDELSQIPFIDAKQFKSLLEGGGTSIIDTRQVEEFNSKHIKGALNFPLGEAGGAIVRVEDGNFAIWVGTLVSNETKLLIVTKQGKESETLQRLARIAYTNV
jgi:rhodanese-related sulfurtransferase